MVGRPLPVVCIKYGSFTVWSEQHFIRTYVFWGVHANSPFYKVPNKEVPKSQPQRAIFLSYKFQKVGNCNTRNLRSKELSIPDFHGSTLTIQRNILTVHNLQNFFILMTSPFFLCIDVFRNPFKETVALHTVLYEGKTRREKLKARKQQSCGQCTVN
jgi:hypothetical protein